MNYSDSGSIVSVRQQRVNRVITGRVLGKLWGLVADIAEGNRLGFRGSRNEYS